MWALTEFATVVFLDADTFVVHDLAQVFSQARAFAATPDDGFRRNTDRYRCNAGVMVVRPDRLVFDAMMRALPKATTCRLPRRCSDQGFLQWWFNNSGGAPPRPGGPLVSLPDSFNVLKRREQTDMVILNAHVIHLVGIKPWDCRRTGAQELGRYPLTHRLWENVRRGCSLLPVCNSSFRPSSLSTAANIRDFSLR